MLTPTEIVGRAEAAGAAGLLARSPSWPRVLLGELVLVQNGAPFRSELFNTSGKGFPLVRIRDIGTSEPTTYYDGDYEPAYIVSAGDLLVGMDGDFRAATWRGLDGLLNQRVCRLSVRDRQLDQRWLAHILPGYLDAIWRETSSITVKHLSSRTLAQIPIPLPPLAEQHRIVEVLEDHLSRLDAAGAMLTAAQERSTALRARAVEAAFARPPIDGAEGSAAERLLSIAKSRGDLVAQRRRAAARPAYQLDLPLGWVTASVDELCWQIQYGTSTKAHEIAATSSLPVLRMGNIQDGEIDCTSLKYITEDDPSLRGLLLEPGDLLFNRTNSAELVGKTAVFSGQLPKATFASYLIRCRAVPGVSTQWISLVVNSSIGRRYIDSVMSQQVGQANVNGTKLAAMPIPIASAAAEETLLEQILELRRSAARLSDGALSCVSRSGALRRSLLRAAFNGELVDQDPNDEPADAALARIRDQLNPTRKRAARRATSTKS